MKKELKEYKNIHMIGIGGASMYAIAAMLKNDGKIVTGSDMQESFNTKYLESIGINVVIGHSTDLVKWADLVIYTAAISDDDPELAYAKEFGIEAVDRALFLGEYTKEYENLICISGTHGKSTTTSMIASVFLEAGLNPTINIGASLKRINGNYYIGDKKYFILEACEYVDSFLHFHPTSEVILNIDNDHLDYFKNFENIKNAFIKYVKILPDNGLLVVNGDDINCLDLISHTKAKALTYGITNKNTDFFATNIVFDENGFASFDVYSKDKFYGRIALHIPGMHNVLNALATIALCSEYGIKYEFVQSALNKFTGAHRRFEFVGKYHDSSIYDDYGHHPTEIVATAKALMNKTYHQSWVIFQPHTYSRTKNLLEDFAKALLNFDHIIVTDIYAARETNTFNISSLDLVNHINTFNDKAIYMKDFQDIANYIRENVKEHDIVLTLGAGTIEKVGKMIVE